MHYQDYVRDMCNVGRDTRQIVIKDSMVCNHEEPKCTRRNFIKLQMLRSDLTRGSSLVGENPTGDKFFGLPRFFGLPLNARIPCLVLHLQTDAVEPPFGASRNSPMVGFGRFPRMSRRCSRV